MTITPLTPPLCKRCGEQMYRTSSTVRDSIYPNMEWDLYFDECQCGAQAPAKWPEGTDLRKAIEDRMRPIKKEESPEGGQGISSPEK